MKLGETVVLVLLSVAVHELYGAGTLVPPGPVGSFLGYDSLRMVVVPPPLFDVPPPITFGWAAGQSLWLPTPPARPSVPASYLKTG